MLSSKDINDIDTITGSISPKEKILLYSIYNGVARRAPISNVGIEVIGSAGKAGSSYQAVV